MRKIIAGFFIFYLLSIIHYATAVPASPYPFTLEQPDGNIFQARQYGDERIQWIETLDGYSIVKEENEWWTYAAKNKEGELIPTNYRVGMVKPLSVVLEKHITPDWRPDTVAITKSIPGIKIKTIDSKGKGMSGIASATTEKVVVILINFIDVPQQHAHDKTYYDNLLFNKSPDANSMFNYFREVSFGQSNVTGSTENKWYKSSHTMAYYGKDETGVDENKTRTDPNTWYIFNLAREAVQLADADIDFSQYDTDSDGVVDHVIIVHAGNAQESSYYSSDIWSHKWSIYNYYSGSGWSETGVTVDGVKVIEYTMLAEGSPLGTFAHEFFHDLGAPELYDYDNGMNMNYPVGKWDLMDYGSWNNYGNTPSHMGGYLKWDIDANPDNGIQGWLTPVPISTPQTLAIDNLESSTGNRLFKVDITGTNQYFLVENRQLTGYDSSLPESGILIWHIDEDMRDNSGPPDNAYHRVWVEDPGNTYDKSGAAYSSNDGQTSFNQTTVPNSNQNDGTSTGIKIYNIGTSGSSMNVTFFNTAPMVTVTSPNGDEAISGNMTVRWVHTDIDPTDVHTITVQLSSDGGTTYPITLVSGLNDPVSFYEYNTVSLPDGSNYKVKVTATDNYTLPLSGNDSSDGVFTIENTPPVIIGNPTGYPVGQTAAKNGSRVTLNASIIEYGAGVKNATVNASQINVSLMTPLVLAKVNDYWIYQNVIVNAVDGMYSLPVQAYDNALNSNSSPAIQVMVDNSPPNAVARVEYQKGNAANNGSTIILHVSATDNPGGSGIKNVTASVSAVNSGNIITLAKEGNNWTGSLVVAAPEGNHSLNIIVMDNASNVNYTAINVTMDNTPPDVVGNTPTGTNVPVTTVITATFNESMNRRSVERAFSIIPSVEGTLTWSGDTMNFTPSDDLAYTTTYEVTIGTGAEDLAGNPLRPNYAGVPTAYLWNFTTAAEPDNTPPTVVGNTPTGTNVPVTTAITVTFDESMNMTSTERAFSTSPSVAGTLSWSGDTMIFTPSADLAYSTTYEVTIGMEAEDAAGNPLQPNDAGVPTAYLWNFTTAAEPDNTPPTVVGNTPTGTNIPVTTAITVTFNESMNMTSAERAFSTSPSVAGTLSWSGFTMTFTPSADLAYSTTYEVTIGMEAEDAAGNPLATANIWDFITSAEPDNSPPAVIGNTPTGTDVPVTTAITVTFNESMNMTSAERAFSTSPSVAGTLSWSGFTMTFTPSADLAYSTTYEVTIGTGAEDVAGNRLAASHIWDFITESNDINFNTRIITNASNSTFIYASGAGVILELFTNDSLPGTINITRSHVNITDELNVPGPGIYIRIDASTNFSNDNYSNISWVKIIVHYSDKDIRDNNLAENSLRLYWFNQSSGSWIKLVTNSPPWVFGTGVDTANNYVWANVSHFSDYAVGGELQDEESPVSNGGSGGGGGGGGGSTSGEDFYNIVLSETDRQSVFKNSRISYRFELEKNVVKHINFTALNSAGTVVAKVEILNHTSTLVSVQPPHEVYKNMNIWVGNYGWATPKNMADVTIIFTVEKLWINENNIDEATIALYRYRGPDWDRLVTRKIAEDARIIQFEAETPGFSPFAVAGEKFTMVEPGGEGIFEEPEAEKMPVSEPIEKKEIPGFMFFVGLALFIIVVLISMRKK